MRSAYSMAGQIRRSKTARAAKYNREHQAYELIEWGMKFLEAGIDLMPDDVPLALQLRDPSSGVHSELSIGRGGPYRSARVSNGRWNRSGAINMILHLNASNEKIAEPRLSVVRGVRS